MNQHEKIMKCCGMRCGHYTETEFAEFYGFPATDLPEYLEITPKNRFVCQTKKMREYCDNYFAMRRERFNLLSSPC